mmetsp:Transcript_28029/g.53356  ORF Transcript_28029/g.53356 Transcript_28029/m.53356 type:complete len:768 (-) Transcript_28029:199-2502(-)|eukprot:CAMPEP_0114251740 /NCGR_PEP_ID=MMETSP0058-20121206/15439_1 /TAXON_ID=36894 /ORGANISM="Pyramimonas parkeae, CCMP726" /LENGTH=767 /DNA_ID=CAMNT_0001365577 /DNA_START=326 /DNA_END=2629 /DNA_ORIENTATION=+
MDEPPAKIKKALTISNKQHELYTHIHVVASNRPALVGGLFSELITWQLGVAKSCFVTTRTHCWCSMLVTDTVQGGKMMSQIVPGMISALRATTSLKGELTEDRPNTSDNSVRHTPSTIHTQRSRHVYIDIIGYATDERRSCEFSIIKVAIPATMETPLMREMVMYICASQRLGLVAGASDFNGSMQGVVLFVQERESRCALREERLNKLLYDIGSKLVKLERLQITNQQMNSWESPSKDILKTWMNHLFLKSKRTLEEVIEYGMPEQGCNTLLLDVPGFGNIQAQDPRNSTGAYQSHSSDLKPLQKQPGSVADVGVDKPQKSGMKSSSSFTLLRQLGAGLEASPQNSIAKFKPTKPQTPPSTAFIANQMNRVALSGEPNRQSRPKHDGSADALESARSFDRIDNSPKVPPAKRFYPNHAWHKMPWATGHRNISIADFELQTKMGSGMTSNVYLARLRDSEKYAPGADDYVVLKVMPKTQVIDMGHRVGELVVSERAIMELVQGSPFILCLFGHFQDAWALFMVIDVASCDFFNMMTHHFGTRDYWKSTKIYAAQVLLAIEHMHSKGLLYRDLKPENMLVKRDGNLVIADFGMSVILKGDERAHSICGTAEYMCPEMVTHQGYRFMGELWAYGVFLYELLTGTTPFEKDSESADSAQVLKKIRNHSYIQFPAGCKVDASAKELIRALLQRDENERLGAMDAPGYYASIRHAAWFRDLDWDAVKTCKLKPSITISPSFAKNLDFAKNKPLPWEHGHTVDSTSSKLFSNF